VLVLHWNVLHMSFMCLFLCPGFYAMEFFFKFWVELLELECEYFFLNSFFSKSRRNVWYCFVNFGNNQDVDSEIAVHLKRLGRKDSTTKVILYQLYAFYLFLFWCILFYSASSLQFRVLAIINYRWCMLC
jgi:hypothetical protein